MVSKTKRSSPKLRLIFWPESEIQTFSAQKQVVSKIKIKKKVFTKIETDFSARIGNSNVFSAQNQVVSKKKKTKKKQRSSPTLRLIFRPESEIQTFFRTASQDLLHNFGTQFPLGGAVFNFSPKIGLKSTKNEQFCILHKSMGGLKPPLATLLPVGYFVIGNLCSLG